MKYNLKIFVFFVFISPSCFAEALGIPALTLVEEANGEKRYTLSIQIIAFMTALSFLPAIILMMTSFTRIIVVFAILRQAIGLQQTPSNQILVGLALFVSFFIMSPVFERAYSNAVEPYVNETISAQEALDKLQVPFREFMLSQTRESDLGLFAKISTGSNRIESINDFPLMSIIPAFVLSELKTAFQIGFLLFIPFLIIDLVVASVLMAMGMMMLSPLIVSLPFKIMLFVFVDGWSMITSTLTASFGL